MLIGIDVGGTYTDGVLFDSQRAQVLKTIKVPTRQEQLQSSLLEVLDHLLLKQNTRSLRRIVLSTTLVTNLLATNSAEAPALILIPGPGLPNVYQQMFPHSFIIQGSIDFRGREVEGLEREEIVNVVEIIRSAGLTKIAVVGKFSNRNSQHEQAVRDIIREVYPAAQLGIGSELAGQLNFLRRIATSYYSLMTQNSWGQFAMEIKKAMQERQLEHVPLDILKADGGTMPLKHALQYPCETILSGPAASTMGAIAVAGKSSTAVVLDIGGTTTDISLLLDGQPLYASRGARINDHYTHVKAISTRSLALGGDSPIRFDAARGIYIDPVRCDQAACFGGRCATVIDVFNCKYSLGIGEPNLSLDCLRRLQAEAGIDLPVLLISVEALVMAELLTALKNMFAEWENEPAYRVWEVVHDRKFKVRQIIGIGAAAEAIVPILADRIQVDYFIHQYAPVANAIGAAVARPTLAFNLHIDTQKGSYFTDFNGLNGTVAKGSAMQMADAQNLARELMQQLAGQQGLAEYAEEAEFTREEQFNIIRGWESPGKIFELGMQIKPGFINEFKEGSL